jgi:hypothetical protein
VVQGIVAFGLIPNNAKDSTGDTIGGIGSAIALKLGSWNPHSDGTFTGTLIVQPDRGYNMYVVLWSSSFMSDLTLSQYLHGRLPGPPARGRLHAHTVLQQRRLVLQEGTTGSFHSLHEYQVDPDKYGQTLALQYKKTLLYDANGQKTTGLDALNKTVANPPLPIPNSTFGHISFDCEGLVLNSDGT